MYRHEPHVQAHEVVYDVLCEWRRRRVEPLALVEPERSLHLLEDDRVGQLVLEAAAAVGAVQDIPDMTQ